MTALARRRLLNGGVDVNELFIVVVTILHSSPESSPIASSNNTLFLVGTNDGAKLKEDFVTSPDDFVRFVGVSAVTFASIEDVLESLFLLATVVALSRLTSLFESTFGPVEAGCFFVLFDILKGVLVAAASVDAFASIAPVELILLFWTFLGFRDQCVGLVIRV